MRLTPALSRRSLGMLVAATAIAVAGCGRTAGPTDSPSPVAMATQAGSAAASGLAGPTPVPGGQTAEPGPDSTVPSTTETDWGTIAGGVPADFPMFPESGVAEIPGVVVSASFEAPGDVETVAGWYRDRFTERGYAVELSDPLEDGGRVLDAQADLPECRIQMTFTPQRLSTIIGVLLASACVGGAGG